MPHKSDSNYHKDSTLSLSPPKSIYRYYTLFLLNKHFSGFTTSVFVGILFCKAKEKRKDIHIWMQSSKEQQGEIRKPS